MSDFLPGRRYLTRGGAVREVMVAPTLPSLPHALWVRDPVTGETSPRFADGRVYAVRTSPWDLLPGALPDAEAEAVLQAAWAAQDAPYRRAVRIGCAVIAALALAAIALAVWP